MTERTDSARKHLKAAALELSKAADSLSWAEGNRLAEIMCANLATMALNIESRILPREGE